MNKISNITAPELIPVIKALYLCLFDTTKKFTSLKGFEELVDSGIVKFKGIEDCRKLSFKYKGKKYELALFNYIRDNGNTIGIRNGETDSNFIQYVLDKFIQVNGTTIEFIHDGVITGSSGKTKEACIDEIAKLAPHLIKIVGKNRIITLGSLKNGYQFEYTDFQSLIANFIEYSILRNNFKNNLTSNGFSNFKEAIEGYRIHLSNNPIVNARFKLNKCNKVYVWVQDVINGFTDLECHYELIIRDKTKISVEIHFEDKNKQNYLAKLKDHLPKNVFINNAHKPSISLAYDEGYPFDDLDLFTKIDEGLLYLNEHLGVRIRKIKTTKYSIEAIEKLFKEYLDKTVDAPKTASAYFSAIPRLTKIGIEIALLDESLYELQDTNLVTQFHNAIVRLDSYKEINKTSHNGPSSVLKKYREFIIDHFTSTSQETSTDEPMSLNQILYGPPGTGKTYNTINKALKLINDAEVQTLDWDDRTEVKKLFDKKVIEGQIVFTTFHQNMSYEDFIEGIKPITIDGEVTYEIIRGIFKKLCDEAKKKEIKSNNFLDAYQLLLEDIKRATGQKMVLETLVHAKEFTIYENSQGNIKFHANTEKAYPGVIKKEILEHYLKTGEALDWPSYTKSLSKFIVDNYGYTQSEESVNKKFVMIIDEINRGNVSKIFGELITLIEESKRAGKSEAITATLPYSKEEFSVPDNVYILGTMNTADRSVEALDTALRRRFDFIEMMPKYNLIEAAKQVDYGINGCYAFDILETINNRLEVLLGRDHLIGHSFFILDENESIEPKVKSAFYKNIIPLLQEYFYGDYNKIGLVLGSGFVEKKPVAKAKELFANNREFSGDDYANNAYTFEIIDYTDIAKYPTNVNFYNALDILMNKAATSVENE